LVKEAELIDRVQVKKKLYSMGVDKELVKKILDSFKKLNTSKYTDEKDNLDLKRFNNDSHVKKNIETLRAMRVTKKWLFDNGFIAAGMVLKI